MTVTALLSDTSIVASPGGEETVRLSVRNVGPDVETFAVVPSGLCAGWVTVAPATLALLPDEEQTVMVTLRPPRASTVVSGESVLALRIVPHGRPADVVVVEASVTVLEFASRRLVVAQPVQVGARSAVYDIVLENHGNQRASCRLSFTDPGGRLVGRFDPPSIGVDPGQSGSARLRVRARRLRWTGEARSSRFTIDAEQDGQQTATVGGTFVQSSITRSRTVGAIVGIGAAAAVIAAAWSLVVRPAIDDAAADAVADALVEDGTGAPVTSPPAVPDTGASTGPSTGPGPDTTAAPTVESTPAGAALNATVTVSAAPGESASQQLDTDGTAIEISDLVVQNPSEDLGRLTIGIGDDVLFTFDLETVYGFEQVELQTPIVVSSGDALVVTVACDAPGDPAAPACSPAVFLSGRGL